MINLFLLKQKKITPDHTKIKNDAIISKDNKMITYSIKDDK